MSYLCGIYSKTILAEIISNPLCVAQHQGKCDFFVTRIQCQISSLTIH